MKKKGIALVMAVALLIVATVGGTLAWLTATSDEVVNTFTTSDITVELKETKTDFKMIPGYDIEKDPKAKVVSGSEECWLFVKLVKSDNFDSYLTYEIADGWTQLTKDRDDKDITDLIYYRKVESANIGTAYSVLKNDQVTVKGEVTKKMMTAANTNQPTLTITAYASQLKSGNSTGAGASNEFTAAQAWANIPGNTPSTTTD